MVDYIRILGWVILTALAIKTVYGIGRFFYSLYFGAMLGHNTDPGNYGPWAVVTGATDGIGKAYARKFAGLGLNIVLISRTASRLKQAADEMRRENPKIQITTVTCDFTEGHSIYSHLAKELSHLSIGILVNNVGMKLPVGGVADVPSGDEFRRIINCNMMSVARMTNLILPGMRKQRRGLIINIGSIAGTGFAIHRATYGATKAFVDKFSLDLAAECRPDGIVVQSVLPGYVATKLPGLSGKSSFDVPTPDAYVESALRTVGIETRTAGYWFHNILLFLLEIVFFFASDLNSWLMTTRLLIRPSNSDRIGQK